MPPLNERDHATSSCACGAPDAARASGAPEAACACGAPDGACASSAAASTAAADSAPASRRTWWRSIEEQSPSPELLEALGREFPEGASELPEGEDRRTFLKLMGASAALAGIGLSACRRMPETKIVPYAVRPSDRIPGKPVLYATAMEYGGAGIGLLATSFDSRPIKLDGNPESWMGRGTSTITQARLIELYNPERSLTARLKGHDSNDAAFTAWMKERSDALAARGGEGLAFLTEAFTGPTWADLKARVSKRFPKATWTTWEPLSNDASLEGLAIALGASRRILPDYSRADVVVSFDDDFLNASPLSPRFTRDFATLRRPDRDDPRRAAESDGRERDAADVRRERNERAKHAAISRLYAFEGTLSVTGMNADERFALRPSMVAAAAARVASGLGVFDQNAALKSALDAAAAGFDPSTLDAGRRAAFERLIEDLRTNRGRGLVTAGVGQPAAVHALCAAINEALGNVGATVRYAPALETPSLPQLRSLVEALQAGKVDTLVVIGGNPVYTAPADLDFGAAMAKAPNVVHQSLEVNETSLHAACTWHVPAAHFLESWGDVRSWDHSVSLQQPLILPLIPDDQTARSPIELLALVLGEAPSDGEALVRRVHMRGTGLDAEAAWRRMLDRGVVPETAAALEARPAVRLAEVAKAVDSIRNTATKAHEIAFFADMKVYDGRFGSIGWLQELPDPVTKITWDNAALLSPATAEELGVRKGDMIRITSGGRSITAAAWPLPGHAEGALSIALGYGRGECGSSIAKDAGFNAYALRSSTAMWIAPEASLEHTGEHYALAHTQDHGISEAILPEVPHQGIQDRLPTLVRQGTLEKYREEPDFAHHATHVAHRLSLWEETNLDGARFRWAMSVDLSACTGCSACVIACQAENNIPIVGKDQVARGRELHWMRIDRYFKGRDRAKPEGFAIAPVTCMQCENAPCEQVCPVAATSHDEDGLNNMVYNRCIGTRYCSNNCPYKVRRFNFFDYQRRTPIREQEGPFAVKPEYLVETGPHLRLRMQFNPEVTVRMRGVMEKCTFCVQRIQSARIKAKNAWAKKGGIQSGTPDFVIPDGTITTACQDACPAEAIVFGDLNDPNSRVKKLHGDDRSYQMLEELNTKTRLRYMARITNPVASPGYGDGHEHDHHGGHDAHGRRDHHDGEAHARAGGAA